MLAYFTLVLKKGGQIMKTFGETIQKIRKSRGITQAELSNNLLNRTTLSKIENSLEEPSYHNASLLIKRLGITQEEFDYIRNNYNLSPKEQIIYDTLNIAYNSQNQKIDSLLKRCQLISNDDDIQMITSILEAFKTGNIIEARKIIIPLWKQRISKIENWNILDLYVLNMIFFVFDEETMIGISNRAIDTIETKYPFLKSLNESFALNKAAILVHKKKFSEAIPDLQKACKLARATCRYDKLFLAKGRLAICQKNKKEAIKCLNILKAMEALDVYRGLKTEIKEFADWFNES